MRYLNFNKTLYLVPDNKASVLSPCRKYSQCRDCIRFQSEQLLFQQKFNFLACPVSNGLSFVTLSNKSSK